jgi:hypothetical protein
MPRRFLTQAERSAIASDYADGLSLNAICRKHRVAYSTANYSVRVSGVTMRAPHGKRKPHITNEAIVWMLGRGMRAREIARVLGVDKTTVIRRGKRLGISFPRCGMRKPDAN